MRLISYLYDIDGLTDLLRSRQSVPINKLELLGEDPSKRPLLMISFFVLISLFLLELDDENLNSGAKQKWKPSASKQQCREAYELRLILLSLFVLKVILSSFFFFFCI